jgi:hypothetical protein
MECFLKEIKKINQMTNDRGRIYRCFDLAERTVLSPLMLLDDTKYQNIMIPYVRIRSRLLAVHKLFSKLL